MYLFDFGTNGLMPVTDIPHVADYFTVDQEDKIAKAIRIFNDEIDRRKKILSQYRVTSISEYRNYLVKQFRMSLFLLITLTQ